MKEDSAFIRPLAVVTDRPVHFRSASRTETRWLLLIVAFALLFPNVSSAVVRRVPEDHPTIHAAINAANAGDTVDVAPGTYLLPSTVTIGIFKYSVIVNKPITLKSRELYQAVLDGTGDNTVLLLVQASAHIEGFILQNAFKGIQQRNSADVSWTARHLIVRDVQTGLEINSAGPSVGTGIISNVVIANCHDGFNTNDARGFVIRNSVVTNCDIGFVGFSHFFFEVSYTSLFNNGAITGGSTPISFGPGIIQADPQFVSVVIDNRQFPFFLTCSSPLVDGGDPDAAFNDVFFPPSLGGNTNDIGAYGGPGAFVALSDPEKQQILQQAGCVPCPAQSITVDRAASNGVLDLTVSGSPCDALITIQNLKNYWTNFSISTVGNVTIDPLGDDANLYARFHVLPPSGLFPLPPETAVSFSVRFSRPGESIAILADPTVETGDVAGYMNYAQTVLNTVLPGGGFVVLGIHAVQKVTEAFAEMPHLRGSATALFQRDPDIVQAGRELFNFFGSSGF